MSAPKRGISLLLFLLLLAACGGERQADERLAQILMLEDSRNADMELLGPLLQDQDPAIRARAVLALGRIGLLEFPDDAFREELVRLLRQDEDPSVRAMAAFALGEAQETDALMALVAAFSDSDEGVREMAVEAVSKLDVKGAASALLDRLEMEESEQVKRRILLTSWRLANPSTARRAIELLSEDTPHLGHAVYHLARFPRGDEPEPPFQVDGPLLARLPDKLEAEASAYLARLLRTQMVADPDPQLLSRLLAHPEAGVRIEALRTAAARSLVDAAGAMQGFESDAPHVLLERLQAAAASEDASTPEKIEPWLAHESPALASAALTSLHALAPEGVEADLPRYLQDGRPQVRAAAVSLFPAGDGDALAEQLDKALDDPHPLVRNAAVQRWQSWDRPRATQRLLELLGHPDPVVKALAAGGLRQRGPQPHLDALAAAYGRLRDDPNFEAKSAVLGAVQAALPDEQALLILRSALDDPDRNARVQAAVALKDVDGPSVRDKIGVRDLDRDLGFYRRVLEVLEDRKGAQIETSRGRFNIRFYPQDAPLTVYNFIALAEKGYFEGITIHRVVPHFVLQAGCPRGDGWGGPGYDIRCEINTRRYTRGAVGMALAGKDTGGSQWFAAYSPQHHLDGGYTVWAQVEGGWDVLASILPGDTIVGVSVE